MELSARHCSDKMMGDLAAADKSSSNKSSASAASSSSSVPASDDATDDEMDEVQRAITAAANNNPNGSGNSEGDTDDIFAGSRSGDSPPPPERKLFGVNKSPNNNNAIPAATATGSPGKRNNKFQFYVPVTDYAAIGTTTSNNDNNTMIDNTGGGGALPDPPSAAEETARKARSRLIQLQISLNSGKVKQSSSSGGGGGGANSNFSAASSVLNDNKDDVEDDEEEDYPQMNFDPIESDDEVNPTDTIDDDEDGIDEDDAPDSPTLPPVGGRTHRVTPKQLMTKLHAGKRTFDRSKSNQPVGGGGGDVHALDRSTSSHASSSSGGGRYQQVNHYHNQQQQQQQLQHLHHSSPALLAKYSSRRQSSDLYSDGIDLLETAASEARERDEVDTLNDSITYLRNLQLSDYSKSSADASTRKAAPLPPPPPHPSLSDPWAQYGPITRLDNTDDILEFRTRSNSLDGNSLNNIGTSSSKTGITSSSITNHHNRPLPPPPQQQQYRQAQSVTSTPADSKRHRPKITAAEAMNFVMNATSARVHNDDDDDYDNEGDKAVDRMNAFLNTISRGDEMPHPDDDNLDEMILLARRSGSSYQTDSGDDIDDDDFEQNTSLSMHAEAKSPSTSSKYAESKHKSIMDNAKSQLDRLAFDDRKNSLLDNRQNLSISDEQQSDRTPPRRTSSIDPPDLDEFGLTSSNSSINPSVLPLQTMNERLYGVETVIPSTSFEHGFSRQSSKDARAPMAALGPRSKRPGGITGVVLDVGSNESEQYRSKVAKGRAPTSSYGSGSRVIAPQDTDVDNWSQSETQRLLLREDFGDIQSISQMMRLCSHLLPIGFNSFFRNDDGNDVNLSWDDEDPDETGYIVHRLTDSQLINVENAFEKMVNSFEQSSANKV